MIGVENGGNIHDVIGAHAQTVCTGIPSTIDGIDYTVYQAQFFTFPIKRKTGTWERGY